MNLSILTPEDPQASAKMSAAKDRARGIGSGQNRVYSQSSGVLVGSK